MIRAVCCLIATIVLLLGLVFSQTASNAAPAQSDSDKYSGMYSFLREGEFVQVTVEDKGKVTGFVSRFGARESDRGAFLDQFFKDGKLEGTKLTFTTQPVHGVWFAFKGIIDRGEGKSRGDEAYYVLKGTLTEYSTDEVENSSSRSREVVFKSFPQDMAPSAPKKD